MPVPLMNVWQYKKYDCRCSSVCQKYLTNSQYIDLLKEVYVIFIEYDIFAYSYHAKSIKMEYNAILSNDHGHDWSQPQIQTL